MRTALLLLISLCFVGCKVPVSEAQADPDLTESIPADEEFPTFDPSSDPSGSDRSPPPSSSEPEGLLGPDPLADEQPEINGLKGAAHKEGVWLNYYHDSRRPEWAPQTQWLKGWANKRGLTVSTFGEPNFRYAVVRLVDVGKPEVRDKVTRGLVYEPYKVPMYPTLVLVNQNGTELCHNVGSINEHHLSEDYDKFSRTPSKRKMGVAALEPEYRVEDPVRYECGPNGCRIVRRK